MLTSRTPRHPALTALVEQLWWSEAEITHDTDTILPTGRAQLIVGVHPDRPVGGVIQGPRSTPAAIDPAAQRRAVGIAFRPSGIAAFVGAPASELADRFVALDDLWSGSGSLVDELTEAEGAEAAFDRLERELVRRLAPERATDPPLDAAEAALACGATVGEVVTLVGTDRRRLASRFAERFGFGLKRYSRIRRFDRALRMIRRDDAIPFARIAAELGFADQAHLSREVRDFSGVTAQELRNEATDAPTHLRPSGVSFKTSATPTPTMGG